MGAQQEAINELQRRLEALENPGRPAAQLQVNLQQLIDGLQAALRPQQPQPAQYRIKFTSKFDGRQDVRKFLDTFEAVCVANEWNDEQAVLQLRLALEGRIAETLQGVTFEEVRNFLLQRYHLTEDQARRELKSISLKRGENIYDYGDRVLCLVKLAHPHLPVVVQEDMAVKDLLDSVGDWYLRREFRTAPPESFTDGLQRIHEYNCDREEKVSLRYVDTGFEQDQKRDTEVKQLQAEVSSLKLKMSTLETEVSKGHQTILASLKQLKSSMAPRPATPSLRGPCFYCNKPGHQKKDCRKRLRDEPRESSTQTPPPSKPIPTAKCQREPCTSDEMGGEENSVKVYQLGQCSRANNSSMCLEAYFHHGHKERMLLDSGCSHSILPVEVRDRLPAGSLGTEVRKPAVGRLADGATVTIEGEVDVTFRVGKQWLRHTFLVAPISNTVLLGMDFFQKHSCQVDFGMLTVRVNEEEIGCCDLDGTPLTCKVTVPRKVTVPARSEIIASGRLSKPVNKTGVMEPQQVQTTNHLQVARTLTSPIDRMTPVRILNTGSEDIMVPAGTTVGQFIVAELPDNSDDTEVRSIAVTMASSSTDLPVHLTEHFERWTDGMSEEDKSHVQNLLVKYSSVFSCGEFDVGRTQVIRHNISLMDNAHPVKQRPYRHGHVQEEEIERQVKNLKSLDLIEESHGAWSSPVIPVRKRDGTWRLCVDYRKLNALTKHDAYPLPRIDDSLDALGGSKIFSTLDLASGYWQVELDEEAKEKAAFVTRSGLWAWKVMPFGLTSAPATFERLMEKVLRGLHWETLLIYLDDVIIFAKDMSTHLQRLEEVLRRLKEAGLKLKPSKCQFFADSVNYLGHVVSRDGVSTDPAKVEAVTEWPVPKSTKDVRAFLGTTGYYRRFIPGYTERAKPLTHLLSKQVRFQWTPDCTHAFDDLKLTLITAPVLAYPDHSLPFILDTDASDVGTGAVLGQVQDGMERVVAYYSKSLSKEENNYCTTRKELLAVIRAVKHFRPYLWGKRFTIRTDHASLQWLMKTSQPKGQVARWMETLADFEYVVKHRKGLKHSNADGLSRRTCSESCRQCQNHFPSAQSAEECQVRAIHRQSEIVTRQQLDVHIAPVYKALQHRSQLDELSCRERSWETRRLVKMAEHLSLREDGVLIARIPVNGRRKELVICPGDMRRALILATHEQAHLGQNKTTSRLLLNWYWPGLTAHV